MHLFVIFSFNLLGLICLQQNFLFVNSIKCSTDVYEDDYGIIVKDKSKLPIGKVTKGRKPLPKKPGFKGISIRREFKRGINISASTDLPEVSFDISGIIEVEAISVMNVVNNFSSHMTNLTKQQKVDVDDIKVKGSIGALLYFLGLFNSTHIKKFDKRYDLNMYVPNELGEVIVKSTYAQMFQEKSHVQFTLRGHSVDYRRVQQHVYIEFYRMKIDDNVIHIIDKKPKPRLINDNDGTIVLDEDDDIVVID